jgi:hypothetical protein
VAGKLDRSKYRKNFFAVLECWEFAGVPPDHEIGDLLFQISLFGGEIFELLDKRPTLFLLSCETPGLSLVERVSCWHGASILNESASGLRANSYWRIFRRYVMTASTKGKGPLPVHAAALEVRADGSKCIPRQTSVLFMTSFRSRLALEYRDR